MQPHSHSLITWLPASNTRGYYENFHYSFSFRLWLNAWFCQAVALHSMLYYQHFTFPTPFKDHLNRLYFPLSSAHRVSDSKISVAIPASLSHKVFLKRILQWNLWRMASNRHQQRASSRFTCSSTKWHNILVYGIPQTWKQSCGNGKIKVSVNMKYWWDSNGRESGSTGRKPCLNVVLPVRIIIWNEVGTNPRFWW
jgi:hypothetical protein